MVVGHRQIGLLHQLFDLPQNRLHIRLRRRRRPENGEGKTGGNFVQNRFIHRGIKINHIAVMFRMRGIAAAAVRVWLYAEFHLEGAVQIRPVAQSVKRPLGLVGQRLFHPLTGGHAVGHSVGGAVVIQPQPLARLHCEMGIRALVGLHLDRIIEIVGIPAALRRGKGLAGKTLLSIADGPLLRPRAADGVAVDRVGKQRNKQRRRQSQCQPAANTPPQSAQNSCIIREGIRGGGGRIPAFGLPHRAAGRAGVQMGTHGGFTLGGGHTVQHQRQQIAANAAGNFLGRHSYPSFVKSARNRARVRCSITRAEFSVMSSRAAISA